MKKRESGDGLSFREENYNFDGRLLQSTSLKGRHIRNRGISFALHYVLRWGESTSWLYNKTAEGKCQEEL